MVPPDSSFHCHTRSTNCSRPRSLLVAAFLGELVADDDLGGDAGMVGARLPQHVAAAHALKRTSTSCNVKVSACPICRLPVTFGGGIMIV